MKIYTEINYKWLDGQLVETDSKSFEYEGKLTLCGGGGGGGSVLPPWITNNKDIFVDPLGDAQEQFDAAEDSINETVADTNETIDSNIAGIHDDLGEAWDENTDSFQNIEEGMNTNMDKLHDYGKATNDVISDELGRWGEAGLKFAGEVSEFLGMGGDGDAAVDDPTNIKSNDQGLKNKAKANLKVNKSKGRARRSLRIGK